MKQYKENLREDMTSLAIFKRLISKMIKVWIKWSQNLANAIDAWTAWELRVPTTHAFENPNIT